MPYSATGYEKRAEECVRLAKLSMDDVIQRELLSLRQSYLNIAKQLRFVEEPRR